MKNDKTEIHKISVVIPAYNEEKYIGDCLQSIQKQKLPYPLEIIVVDNSSTDSTKKIAEKYGVRVIDEKRKGSSFARQAGLNAASGDILIYVDADVRVPQGILKKSIAYLDNHPDVVALSLNGKFYDGNWQQKLGFVLWNTCIVAPVLQVLRFLGKPDIVIGHFVAVRTASLRKAGGTDRNFAFHGDDTGMALKLQKMGKVRFLRNEYIYCSARRYQREGLIHTIRVYWTTYLLLQLGMKKYAKAFAEKHNN